MEDVRELFPLCDGAVTDWIQKSKLLTIWFEIYVYGTEGDPTVGKTLTLDKARRIASNIAKLPPLLSK